MWEYDKYVTSKRDSVWFYSHAYYCNYMSCWKMTGVKHLHLGHLAYVHMSCVYTQKIHILSCISFIRVLKFGVFKNTRHPQHIYKDMIHILDAWYTYHRFSLHCSCESSISYSKTKWRLFQPQPGFNSKRGESGRLQQGAFCPFRSWHLSCSSHGWLEHAGAITPLAHLYMVCIDSMVAGATPLDPLPLSLRGSAAEDGHRVGDQCSAVRKCGRRQGN